MVLQVERESERPGGGLQHADALGHDLLADPVTRNHRDSITPAHAASPLRMEPPVARVVRRPEARWQEYSRADRRLSISQTQPRAMVFRRRSGAQAGEGGCRPR